MDVYALKAFIEVAECGSFSMAAERLLITQPAVSKRIAGLETELETRLFDRLGKKVLLTESGRSLLPRARSILMEMADARKELSNLADVVQGDLSIATSHHIGLHRLPGPLRQFSRRYPQVRLHVQFVDSDRGVGMVADGSCDVAIVTLPAALPEKLVAKRLWQDPMGIMIADHHPLVKKSGSLKELAAYPTILPAETTTTTTIIHTALEGKGLQPLSTETSCDYETIRMLVSVGIGWSVLPVTMASDGLYCFAGEEFSCTRDLGFLYHGDRVLSNAAKVFVDLLCTCSQGA